MNIKKNNMKTQNQDLKKLIFAHDFMLSKGLANNIDFGYSDFIKLFSYSDFLIIENDFIDFLQNILKEMKYDTFTLYRFDSVMNFASLDNYSKKDIIIQNKYKDLVLGQYEKTRFKDIDIIIKLNLRGYTYYTIIINKSNFLNIDAISKIEFVTEMGSSDLEKILEKSKMFNFSLQH